MQRLRCYLMLCLGCLVHVCGVHAGSDTAWRHDPGICTLGFFHCVCDPQDSDLYNQLREPAETWTTRMLRGVKVNSVTTHLDIGDLLAYDLTVGADNTVAAEGATGTKVNYNTVLVAQAAGVNNVTCLSHECSQPSAQSAGSVTPVTGQNHQNSHLIALLKLQYILTRFTSMRHVQQSTKLMVDASQVPVAAVSWQATHQQMRLEA